MGSLTVLAKGEGARLEWGVASHPQAGQAECGDAYTIRAVGDGCLVAVIDGLGHGPHASRASREAITAIAKADGGSLVEILRACHRALVGTRGAAISMAQIDIAEQRLAWLGVGNVEGMVLNPVAYQTSNWRSEALVARGGVVGYDLPHLQSASVPFGLGAVLVFATDGIRAGFTSEIQPGPQAQQTADQIMAGYDRGTDDALVLVVQQIWGQPDRGA